MTRCRLTANREPYLMRARLVPLLAELWMEHQSRIKPERLVFIDETWTKTNMAPFRGWAPRGARLVAKVPHGHLEIPDLCGHP